ncbi:phosphohydrolase [Spirochaetia bacterium]|nr:phosphohydrolase [Spirochaetia bacterium]
MNSLINAALCEGFTEPIRDSLWGHIYLTPEIEALTKSLAFIRLHRVAQLGSACLCYPGATHTRAAHSLGVYHLTRRLLVNLAERGADEWLTPCGVRSMLCAALFHDLGHFPYAHSLKELPLLRHEFLSAKAIGTEPLRTLIGKTGADPELTAAIVDDELPDGAYGTELKFYRKLLSGCLDPDKLDYLNRDARFCGVPYGAHDVDFIISTLYPHPERGVDIDSRGITGVESILFSKYLMYRSVYWHHSVRSATSMIKKALFAGLKDGVITPQELYNLDDQELFHCLSAREHPLFKLGSYVRQGRLYAMAAEFPFDDSRHGALSDLEKRSELEIDLAKELSSAAGKSFCPNDIIIDVPESFSFETGLFVRDENCYFCDSSSFFKTDEVGAFAKTLRIVRVFVDQAYKPIVKSSIVGVVEKRLDARCAGG